MSDALEYAKRAIKSENDHPGVNPQVLLLARAVVRQDEEIQRLKSTLEMVEKGNREKMDARIDEIIVLRNKVAKLTCSGDCLHNCNCIPAIERKEELVALKEKYRWRKQSEEPAPENVRVLIYDAYRGLFFIETCLYKKTIDYIFWRPLDPPEEEM